MELFQAWWNEREARTGSKPRATKARTGAAKDVDPATVQVSERILATELPESLKPAAGEAVHYAMGAATGAIYGFVAELFPPARLFNGMLMGMIVWWTADNMAVPAEKLGKGPEQTPPSMHAYALASHLVYGLTTDLVRSIVRVVL